MRTTTTDTKPLARLRRLGLITGLALACIAGFSTAQAAADVELDADIFWAPQFFPSGGGGGDAVQIGVQVANVGDSGASGGTTAVWELPDPITYNGTLNGWTEGPGTSCSGAGTSTITCTGIGGSDGLSGRTRAPNFYLGVDVAEDAEGLYDATLTLSNPAQPTPTVITRKMRVSEEPLGFGIDPDNLDAAAVDEDGEDYTQAGGHPFDGHAEVRFSMTSGHLPGHGQEIFRTCTSSGDLPTFCYEGGSVADIVATLPPGFLGNPQAVAQCPDHLFATNCPPESQVGFITLYAPAIPLAGNVAVYNMVPPPEHPAQFAFRIPWAGTQRINASVRADGDYGVTLSAPNITEGGIATRSNVVIWGDPHHPRHDIQRCPTLNAVSLTCTGESANSTPSPSSLPETAFLSMPTNCADVPRTSIRLSRYQDRPAIDDLDDPRWVKTTVEHPPHTGCEEVPFEPDITLEPQTSAADSPTGLDVKLQIPQEGLEDPDGLATAHLKKTEVTLPEGISISPTQADGVDACSPAQIGLVSAPGEDPIRFDNVEPSCPTASKIGQASVETPLLEQDLVGEVFLAESFRNPFGSRYAIYLTVREPSILVKLAGEVFADPETGRLTTTFDRNPQLPFTDFDLRFFGGPRGVLATPTTCATYANHTELSSWAAADPDNPTPAEIVTVEDEWGIDSGPGGKPCVSNPAQRPFNPGFAAGTTDPLAGAHSPFVMSFTRADGDQEIKGFKGTLPQGLTAKLAGVPFCSEAALRAIADPGRSAQQEIDAPLCPEASRIGRANVGAGPGPQPFHVQGRVYLAGPYKGAPLSVAVVTPAKAGPFDLGNVVVRSKLDVDPRTAQVSVESDEIPHILEGVPIRLRSVEVVLDKQDFTLNPTSCEPMQVSAEFLGAGGDPAVPGGATARASQRFQVGGCDRLDFEPRFAFRASGKRATKPNGHPRLDATVVPREGDANIGRAQVTLPRGMFLDQDNLETICTRPQFAVRECPDDSLIGHAIAHTPLLDEPLQGPLHLIASDNPLPDVVADLRGIVDIALFGRTTSNRRTNRITNTFDVVPDAAVEHFRLVLRGGPQGLLVNSRDACSKAAFRRVNVRVFGQNGKAAHQTRMIQSNRCVRQRANRLTRRAKSLRQRARRAARNGNRARAKKLRQRSKRLQRRAATIRQGL